MTTLMLYSDAVDKIYLKHIDKTLRAPKNDDDLFEAIVNSPFHDLMRAAQLDLGVVVLLLVNKKAGTIDRIALSDTEAAAGAVKMSEKPFKDIKIPIGFKDNLIAKAIEVGEVQCITDWRYLFAPALGPRAARFNQAGAGIEFSCACPLKARDGGALIFSFFQEHKNIGPTHYDFMRAYLKLVDAVLRV